MVWVKLDDGFFRHPKVEAAGRDARDLYLAALCYCAEQLTDGFVGTASVQRIAGEARVRLVRDAIERLVSVRLWERVEGGFRIHDYLAYNPSAARVHSEREQAARRQEAWRDSHRNGMNNGTSNAVTNAVTSTVSNTCPVPARPGPVKDAPQPPVRGGGG